MGISQTLKKDVEKRVGMHPDDIKNMGPKNFSKYLEKKTNKAFRLSTYFPYIGHGNVLFKKVLNLDKDNPAAKSLLNISR